MKNSIQERIFELRKILKLNQTSFARKAGLTKTSVSQAETGKRLPTPFTIEKMCNAFSINKDWLLSGVGEIFIGDLNIPSNLVNSYENELTKQLQDEIKFLRDILKTILESKT